MSLLRPTGLIPRLSLDRVPTEHREWVEDALVEPLGRIQDAQEAATVPISRLNAKVVEYLGAPPTADGPLDFEVSPVARVVGVLPVSAESVASGGVETPVGGLSSPQWSSSADGEVRILAQSGLTAGQVYRVRWLVLGD